MMEQMELHKRCHYLTMAFAEDRKVDLLYTCYFTYAVDKLETHDQQRRRSADHTHSNWNPQPISLH